jgi:CheY-like chemotaxis protein
VPLKKILWSDAIRARIDQGKPHFLERAGLVALSAGSAEVLLDAAVHDRPDVIILPADPAGLTAVEICRRLRDDARTRDIPILALTPPADGRAALLLAGCTRVLETGAEPQAIQETIAGLAGVRLRRYMRYPVVLPVARGRVFKEFLGYSSNVSEGGMGFETLARVRADEHLPLRIYRNTEEKPIGVSSRVAAVRPNIDTGVGYAVGVEFLDLGASDRSRLAELFPRDAGVTWSGDDPIRTPPPDAPGQRPG